MPADFAAKVRASLPAQPKVRAQRSVGRMAAGVGTAGLVVALCGLAPHARPGVQNMAFGLEMVLVVELVGVARGWGCGGRMAERLGER